jgi:hypothetical protein
MNLIHIPTWLSGALGAMVLSAAARALPDPKPMGNQVYAFVYRFTHLLLANFDKSAAPKDVQP